MNIKCYTGGLAETHGYLVEGTKGWMAIDAPEGMADYCAELNISALVLTHGHWDHIWDAAELARIHRCPVYYHQADEILITQPDIMAGFGLPIDLEPVPATRFLTEGEVLSHAPWQFDILHIPGHCPGSILLYEKNAGILFGGDVMFAGAVGRWDLPHGDQNLLLTGIRKKLLPLPDATVVYPGHGPDTTLGQEKKTNPFCR